MENIEEQYKNSSNLNTRINIHELYSTNKEDWHLWLFNQYDIPPNSNILEIGCGDGTFWFKNRDRIPGVWNITLSDFSLGMIESAKSKLRGIPNITYRQLNIEEIPFEDNSFDVIIANHMLYHVPNRETSLREVRRVLKTDGVFYCSTIGKDHMREFGQLVDAFDPKIYYASAKNHAIEFGIENGEEQLSPYFNTVSYKDFPGDLKITDVNAIVDYLLSSNTDLSNLLLKEKLTEFLLYLNSVKEANNGAIRITKSTGLFESR
ncbi:MAG: class I SAM-dependent methyltransferase [Bacillota bacterium]